MIISGGRSIVVVVDEMTKIGEARRRTAALSEEIGFNELERGKAALIVTEAATNLIKHAGVGEVLLTATEIGPGQSTLEVMTIDSGPGMRDVSRCLADGYSSAGTPGTGLGAMRRIADSFDIHSAPEIGTVVWARLQSDPRLAAGRCYGLEVGVTSVAAPLEQVCGDGWSTVARDGFCFAMVVDGLGHGPPAALASEEAVRVFRAHRSLEPADIVATAHTALRSTRGAALAIARIDLAHGAVRFAGVGNISGVILEPATGESTSMVSHNGTVGYTIRKIQSFDYRWTNQSLLVMHSDGLATHWNLNRYAGLASRHPSVISGVLYRNNKRNRDDVTVLVARPVTGDQP